MQVLKDFEQRPDKPKQGFGGFIAELRRRHVVRAGIAYVAVAFAVLQGAPDSFSRLLDSPVGCSA